MGENHLLPECYISIGGTRTVYPDGRRMTTTKTGYQEAANSIRGWCVGKKENLYTAMV